LVSSALCRTGQAGSSTAAYWGGGLVAAVDGTRFVVPVRSLHARPNPKYFGRRKGATWLNLINDQGAGTAGMVVSGTARDSLNAVDLLHRRDGGRQPQVLISDTGSYTDMVFGLLKPLGVAYRPELADLPDQKLWRINPSADYLDATLDQLRAEDVPVLDADVARLPPYMYAHINVHGHCTFTAPNLGGGRRPLREPEATAEKRASP
jgi:TnpA family transposase